MFIPGAPTFAEPIQGSIAHIIMMNFARRMRELPIGQTNALILINLRLEIQLFHDQMKYPWGQIVNMERNAEQNTPMTNYYAIKSLSNIVKIINRENFVKLLYKTDLEFYNIWRKSMTEVDKFYDKIQKFEILDLNNLTASTISLHINTSRENNLNQLLLEAIKQVKIAWQTIWEKFKLTRTAFDYVLSDKNHNFEIKLSNRKPFIQDEIMIMLSCNNSDEIRLWARTDINLYKARASTRKLKWVVTDGIYTKSNPTWWLYAIKHIDLDYEENNFANICRPDTVTTDY